MCRLSGMHHSSVSAQRVQNIPPKSPTFACVYMRVCVCARARVRACVCVCVCKLAFFEFREQYKLQNLLLWLNFSHPSFYTTSGANVNFRPHFSFHCWGSYFDTYLQCYGCVRHRYTENISATYYYFYYSFLCAFTKWRQTTISFITVRPSVRTEQLDGFSWKLIFEDFL
jgi:hypothetical protein